MVYVIVTVGVDVSATWSRAGGSSRGLIINIRDRAVPVMLGILPHGLPRSASMTSKIALRKDES